MAEIDIYTKGNQFVFPKYNPAATISAFDLDECGIAGDSEHDVVIWSPLMAVGEEEAKTSGMR